MKFFIDHILICLVDMFFNKQCTDTSENYSYLHTENDSECELTMNFMRKEMILNFPLWIFHLYVATFQKLLIWSVYYISQLI